MLSSLLHVQGKTLLSRGRVKRYPDGTVELLACSEPIFKPDGWEDSKRNKIQKKSAKNPEKEPNSTDRAMRRARAKMRDIALCSKFKYFVTLTLNREKVDRYNMQEITKKLNNWLDNCVRRKGLSYILVPEKHKDGAIHFHGFFNGALPVVDSGHRDKKGHTVYNLPAWTLGFTTAIELYGDYKHAVAYACKYIGKGGEKIGGRWYYSGGELGYPEVSYEDIDYSEVAELPGAYTFSPEGSYKAFAIYRTDCAEKEGNTHKIGGNREGNVDKQADCQGPCAAGKRGEPGGAGPAGAGGAGGQADWNACSYDRPGDPGAGTVAAEGFSAGRRRGGPLLRGPGACGITKW